MAALAFVFDLDGTIWDSAPWFARIIERERGIAARESQAKLHNGTSIISLIANVGLGRTRFGRLIVDDCASLRLYPDVPEVLRALAKKNVALGVFTSLPRDITEPLLKAVGLSPFFAAIVHAGNCRARKPNPLGIHIAMETLHVTDLDRVVYVGDREVDSKAAQNAGVAFAWAAYGYQRQRPKFVTRQIDEPRQLLCL